MCGPQESNVSSHAWLLPHVVTSPSDLDPGAMLLGFQPPEPQANKTSFLYKLPSLTYFVIVTKIKITKPKHFCGMKITLN